MNPENDDERARWDAAAAGWEKHFEFFEREFSLLTEWLLAGVRAGDALLDVACGPGQPAIAAAERGARVTAVDLAPAMVAATARRAAARGLTIDARQSDAEALALPDASFDVATCRFGLMFASDPARAAREIRRVLRPGRRFRTVAWDDPAGNPLFTVIARALEMPPAPPDAPGPFRLAPPGALARTLATFDDVTIEPYGFEIEFGDPEAYWQWQSEMSSALRASPMPRDEVRARVLAALAPFVVGGVLRLPARVLLGSGFRPAV